MSAMGTLTRIAYTWGVRCFGEDHMLDRRKRALRCAEEAIELAQSVGVARARMELLVEIVYRKEPGIIIQELGGVFVTASVLCQAMAVAPETVFEAEMLRVLSKDPAYFTERNKIKEDMGLR